MKKQVTINKTLKIDIPTVPNFILSGEMKFSIKDLSEHDLETIGKEWTKELIRKSKTKESL